MTWSWSRAWQNVLEMPLLREQNVKYIPSRRDEQNIVAILYFQHKPCKCRALSFFRVYFAHAHCIAILQPIYMSVLATGIFSVFAIGWPYLNGVRENKGAHTNSSTLSDVRTSSDAYCSPKCKCIVRIGFLVCCSPDVYTRWRITYWGSSILPLCVLIILNRQYKSASCGSQYISRRLYWRLTGSTYYSAPTHFKVVYVVICGMFNVHCMSRKLTSWLTIYMLYKLACLSCIILLGPYILNARRVDIMGGH